MSDLGISINPMDFLNYNETRKFNKQMASQSASQRLIDNQFRSKQARLQEAWNWRKWNDRDNQLQNLKRDAKRAGVSMLAALGGQGSAPMNINMPVGQGGRVSGNYQRQSPIEARISANLERRSEVQLSVEEIERESKWLDLMMKNKKYQWMIGNEDMPPAEPIPLYLKARDNYDEAVQWTREGYFPYNNPDMNLEMPESVGGYYFFKPRPEGFVVNP